MKIWLVPYLPGWSYDLTAQALKRHLSDRYEIEIIHQERLNRLRPGPADLVVDFWWKGALAKRFRRRTIKQVSSHRWVQQRFGALTVNDLIHGQLSKCGGIAVPSLRLQRELAASPVEVDVCPKGFHPDRFFDFERRGGGLAVGWAGSSKPADKRVSLLVEACPDIRLADECLTQDEMPAFYNSIDVITCASDAEGDPRPLIEGMACGCFPVTTNVGIVPELVHHGINGLIVEQSAQAFADAFAWCRKNIDRVRLAGRRNAVDMLATRTWKHCAERWAEAFERVALRHPPNRDWRLDIRERARMERESRIALQRTTWPRPQRAR